MPVIETTTTGNNTGSSSGQGGGDIGSSGSTELGGTIVISVGSAPTTGYEYDIVSMYGGVGSAYTAINNSNISCNSSVGVFNRNNAFSAVANSVGNFTNCCTYAAAQGFQAASNSRISAYMCVASLSTYNYQAKNSSSLNANICASSFPLLYGTHASYTSSVSLLEFESMTASWDPANGPIPTHFSSSQNSYCSNSSVSLTTKSYTNSTNLQGLSGPVLAGKNISFLWSQVFRNADGTGLSNTTVPRDIFHSNPIASYRYVPFQHSVDYSNISSAGSGSLTDATAISSRGLIQLLAMGRNCYTSVKPPSYMFLPEDNTGTVGVGGLTGAFSVSNLLTSLV